MVQMRALPYAANTTNPCSNLCTPTQQLEIDFLYTDVFRDESRAVDGNLERVVRRVGGMIQHRSIRGAWLAQEGGCIDTGNMFGKGVMEMGADFESSCHKNTDLVGNVRMMAVETFV